MHDIFISYSHENKQIATAVLNILEANGMKCWIDYRDEVAGSSWAASIVRAIKESTFFVIIVSKESCGSSNVINELNSAVNAGKTIIPFKIDDTEISDGFEYYLSKTHWLEALTRPLEDHIYRLIETIRKFCPDSSSSTKSACHHSTAPASSSRGQACRICTYQELLAMGHTAQSVALQLVENDYINCNGIGEENEGTAAQWEAFLQNDSDTFRYLVNEQGKIVGDWSMVALDDDAFQLALKGELLEKDLTHDNTNILCFPGIYHGYILSMAILPDYRSMENHRMLINSFISQIETYAANDIFFDQWCINVFSREVEALIKQLGFRFACNNKTFGKIYTCSFQPLPKLPLFKQYPTLVKKYEAM